MAAPIFDAVRKGAQGIFAAPSVADKQCQPNES
jgi:hypothetical protein